VARANAPALEAYAGPVPLVVEVWSPTTGEYDVDRKFPEYRARGDLEIWRVHPGEQRVTRWIRQADGSYRESSHDGGRLELAHLPGVVVDLDALFEGSLG
jgi:Uma2 family endonuclease